MHNWVKFAEHEDQTSVAMSRVCCPAPSAAPTKPRAASQETRISKHLFSFKVMVHFISFHHLHCVFCWVRVLVTDETLQLHDTEIFPLIWLRGKNQNMPHNANHTDCDIYAYHTAVYHTFWDQVLHVKSSNDCICYRGTPDLSCRTTGNDSFADRCWFTHLGTS